MATSAIASTPTSPRSRLRADGPRERHEHDRRRDGPDGVSGFGLREEVQQPADADRREDAGGKQAVAHEDVGGLTTSTEHGALCATLSLTLPRARTPWRPRLPTTRRSPRSQPRRARLDRVSLLEADVLGDRIDGGRIEVLPSRMRPEARHLDSESLRKAAATARGRCRLGEPSMPTTIERGMCSPAGTPPSNEDRAWRLVENRSW